jgi:flagellar assembly protein FliH
MFSSNARVRPYVFAPLAPLPPPPGPPPPAGGDGAGGGHGAGGGSSTPPAVPSAEELAALRAAAEAEGRAAGYEAGYAEGLQRAAAEQAALTEQLASVVASARVVARGFTAGLEARVVDLVLAVARKVIEREVRLDRAIVLNVIRAALEEIQEHTTVEVRVHPDDYELVVAQWERLARTPLAQRSQFVVDERVGRGGCVIDMPFGQLDAQLDTKLAQIVETFHALLEGDL